MSSAKSFAALTLGAGLLSFAVFAVFVSQRTPTSAAPAPAPAAVEALVRPYSFVKGPETAPVTIVEFMDPQCESCRAMHPIVKDLLVEYGDRVRLVIRYMPLHRDSMLAASALEEARELGKYDQALDVLFENQPIWGSHQEPKPELIATLLAAIGIDARRLEPDYLIPKHQWKIERDQADGVSLEIRGTPVFFVNGVMLPELGYRPLKRAIETALSARAPA